MLKDVVEWRLGSGGGEQRPAQAECEMAAPSTRGRDTTRAHQTGPVSDVYQNTVYIRIDAAFYHGNATVSRGAVLAPQHIFFTVCVMETHSDRNRTSIKIRTSTNRTVSVTRREAVQYRTGACGVAARAHVRGRRERDMGRRNGQTQD